MTNQEVIELIKSLKVGDIYYDKSFSVVIKFKVKTKPVKRGHRWRWTAEDMFDGEIDDYSFNEKMTDYLPELWR